ncbi:MAG: IS701 family transposase [Sneathiellaceae bacterium]
MAHGSVPSPVTEARLEQYVGRLAAVIGHVDRVAPLRAYCRGLLLKDVRKSVESIACSVAGEDVGAMHQSLHHFISSSNWSDRKVLDVARDVALQTLAERNRPMSWVICDSGFVKKGEHTVGVAQKFCQRIGRRANCQSAVFLFMSTGDVTLPISQRLYLPESWARDAARRRRAGVPEGLPFQTRAQIALQQIRQAIANGVPTGAISAGTTYGDDHRFRAEIARLEIPYVLAVRGSTELSAVHDSSFDPEPVAPMDVKALAATLPPGRFRQIRWQHLSDWQISRFAALRVTPRSARRQEPEWLLIEWPDGAAEPQRYWLSTLPADSALEHLVEMSQRSWRGEACYRILKEEIGLGHYEGRGWKGYHHHATLCIAIYNWLLSTRVSGEGEPSRASGFRQVARPATRESRQATFAT